MGSTLNRVVAAGLCAALATTACGSASTSSVEAGTGAPTDPASPDARGSATTIDATTTAATATDSTGAPGSGDSIASTPETTTTDVPLEPRSMTMAFTGDVLPHSPLWRGAAENAGGNGYDFFPMFAPIAPTVSAADLAVCHLETPIVPVGEELSTDPLYGVPPEVVSAMARAGYDRCSTASNHVLDRRVAGIDRTIEVLAENGMGQSGMARNELEAVPAVFDVNGISISHLSYTYGTNGLPIPAGEPWRTNLIEPARIIQDAQSARDLGADVVVVSMHWGTEGVTAPDDQQVAIADAITAGGAIDLVVGHHAHVLQPIEQVNGVWVAYGLGNVLSNHPAASQWPPETQDAAVVEFDVDIDSAGVVTISAPRVVPTWVDKPNGWVIRDVLADLASDTLDESRRQLLQASLDRTSSVLGDYVTR
ncbi:CapA family protein [Ilumatobacter nonamiensis]|uniref:CapA family protein n=1 Tax=Ilumatobacter nonamiensis TaxID=467093 RepID=UPI00034726F4|nr:CapA family protein [Ilumatobacter nonamiensis]